MMYNGGANNGGVDWGYFEQFSDINDKYLPTRGEGETVATQIVTAVNKLIYKWYNDGDVYDNTYHFKGWCNDLSSYANWLAKYTKAARILVGISECKTHADYENLLKNLADEMLDEKMLEQANTLEKMDSIYNCNGVFKYVEVEEDEWQQFAKMKTIKEADAGINIEIPKEVLDKLFNNLLCNYMQNVEDAAYKIKGNEWNEDKIYDEVDRVTSRTLGISLNVLDHIMHGEYVIV